MNECKIIQIYLEVEILLKITKHYNYIKKM